MTRVGVYLPGAPHPFAEASSRWYWLLLKILLRLPVEPVIGWPGAAGRFRYGDVDFAPVSLPVVASRADRWRRLVTAPRGGRAGVHPFDDCDVVLVEQLDLLLDLPANLLGRSWPLVHHVVAEDTSGVGPHDRRELRGWRYGRLAERRALARCDRARAVSDRVADAVRRHDVPVVVQGFGIDTALYEASHRSSRGVRVGYIGSWTWAGSREAGRRLVERVWPLVRAAVPDAELIVAGKRVATYLGRPGAGVRVNGEPEDASELFNSVEVFANPVTVGTGVKVKTLEAMAYGVPVVTTEAGVEGIAAASGEHAEVEATDEGLAAAIVGLLRDRDRADRMSSAARALIERDHSEAALTPVVARLVGGAAP